MNIHDVYYWHHCEEVKQVTALWAALLIGSDRINFLGVSIRSPI